MAFNIKSDETHRLARELAERTGESMAKAVDTSLRERLARVERQGLSERLLEIGREASKLIPPGVDLHQINEDLYDEYGLPK
ncbi:MAG: type II toxin-antitoxin system VapB family antitoxin [Actinobacteria bacterium]|nr:type II toxin-antitoxin system VapB family antitoxin [Actinomycetota bacterium]